MADFTGDGHLDLIVTGGQSPNAYFINDGDGVFLECAEGANLAHPDDWSLGVSVADYDNDGDRDVLFLNNGPNRLLENQGDGSFKDVSDHSGLIDDARSSGASWADLDGDGLLDVFVANLLDFFGDTVFGVLQHDARPRLYRNMGGGRFEERGQEVGRSGLPEGATYIAPMIDFDGDGLVDLLVTQEFGLEEPNRIYQNRGTAQDDDGWLQWQHRTEGANLEYPHAVMGAALFDINSDTLPDIMMTDLWISPEFDSKSGEVLLINQGDFSFRDATEDYNVNGLVGALPESQLSRSVSWATLQLDYDNDGDDDLYTVYGAFDSSWGEYVICPGHCQSQPNLLLRNDDNAYFTQLAGTHAEDHGTGRGLAAGDVNGDGCIDVYVVNQDSPSRLLINRCEDVGHAFFVKLEGTVSNRDAVGSTVVIEAAGKLQTKFVTAGSTSVHSAQPFTIHVGLGDATVVDRLTVIWPTGVQDSFEGLEVTESSPRTYHIREGEGIVDTRP